MDSQRLLPKKLYKYRALSTGQDLEWVKDILLNNRLYFPTRLGFNDPFDSRIHFDWESTEDQWRKRLENDFAKQPLPPEFEGRHVDYVEALLQKGMISVLEKRGGPTHDQIVDKYRILSLCESPKDILMWSHYGSCHSGICLEFKVSKESPFSKVRAVEYAKEYPKVKVALADRETEIKALLTKAKVWKYEKEWRAVRDQASEYYPFPKECLSGVILGCQIDPTNKPLIKEWLSMRLSPVMLYEAVKSKDKFALEIQKIETIGPTVL
jgi:hypothetical protein